MSLTLDSTTTIYIQLPDVTPHRVLHPCTVKEEEGTRWTVETSEVLSSLEVDATLLVYYDERQTFVQQAARVRAIEPADEGLVIELERLGEAVNAEQRQVYRVSCLTVPIVATMNNETDCEVVDISATGFGVHCASRFHTGSAVTAQLHWEGETFRGPVIVVSVRQISDGQHRYGVRCVDSGDGLGTTLRKSLTRISLAVQREQMRRIQ